MAEPADLQVDIDAVRPLLTCAVCSDWFKDAHTIMECLHTFCLSCLRAEFGYDDAKGPESESAFVDRSESKGGPDSVCPICKIPLGADPIKNAVRPDCTMQSLANRIVRCLSQGDQTDIENVEGAMARSPSPVKEQVSTPNTRSRPLDNDDVPLIDIALTPTMKSSPADIEYPPAIYLRTSSQLSVQQLRKYISSKFGAVPEDYDIMWSGEVLGPEYTLDFIQKTRSQTKGQLQLAYSVSAKSKPNFN